MPDWKAIQTKSKAKKPPTAKNVPLGEWMVAIDWLTDERPELMDEKELEDWPHKGYVGRGHYSKEIVGVSFRYVPDKVISAIAGRAPKCVAVRYKVGPKARRTTYVFPTKFAVAILEFLGLDAVRPKTGTYRYLASWNRQSIENCRLA